MAKGKEVPHSQLRLLGSTRAKFLLLWEKQLAGPIRANPMLRYFWIIGTVAGLAMLLVTPPLAGFDGTSHFRAVEYYVEGGRGSLPPQKGMVKPVEIDGQISQVVDITGAIQQKHMLEPSMYKFFWSPPPAKTKLAKTDLGGAAVYSPLAYAPSIVGLALAKMLHLPLLLQIWAARLACLGAYLVLAYFALRWIPFGKWALFVVVLLPMSLFQASTITTDGFLNGLVFLYVAIILRLLADSTIRQEATRRLLWLLSGLGILVALSKPSYGILFLLLLLIPAAKFTSRRARAALLAVALLPGAILGALWNLYISDYAIRVGEIYRGSQVSHTEQLTAIVQHPVHFVFAMTNTLYQNGYNYLAQLIGTFDPQFHLLPVVFAVPLIIAFFIGVAIDAEKIRALSIRSRVYMAALLLSVVALIVMTFYLTYTPVMGGIAEGIQGRYFIPLLVLAIPLLTLKNLTVRLRKPEVLFVTVVTAALAMACLQIPLVDYWLT